MAMEKDNNNEYITRKDLEEQTQVILSALDKRFDSLQVELKKDINNVQILIDAYVREQENFKQEFVIIKEEVKKIKTILKDKLGIEVSAI